MTVTISVYDQSIARMTHMLENLDKIVSKAEAYAEENDIEPEVLLQARLHPTMRNFIFQVQVATDISKGCAARLPFRDQTAGSWGRLSTDSGNDLGSESDSFGQNRSNWQRRSIARR